MDVKNTVEVFDLVIGSCNKAAEAKANDGKISAYEALEIAISQSGAAMEAAKDVKLVPAEMQDLDLSEAKLLAGKGLELKDAVLKLFKA
jgi:hypothetical protein